MKQLSVNFTQHAKNVAQDRGIESADIFETLNKGAQIVQNPRNGALETFTEIPYRKERQFLLISFKEFDQSVLVITAIICGIGHIRKEGFSI